MPDYRAVKVNNGMVLKAEAFNDPTLLAEIDVSDNEPELKQCLESMTVASLTQLIDNIGFRGLPSKSKKAPLVRTILHYWDEIKGNAQWIGAGGTILRDAPAPTASSSGVQVFSGEADRLEADEGDKKKSSAYPSDPNLSCFCS